MYNKALGCLFAGACGDALGYSVEFESWNSIEKQYGENGITSMQLVNGSAQISDDTQMAIYTSQALIEASRKRCDYHNTIAEIHKSYLRWGYGQMETFAKNAVALYGKEELFYDILTRNGKNKALRANRAPGNTCLYTLSLGKLFTTESPCNDSKGCGTVMRVAPVSIATNSIDEAYSMGCDSSALTHGHVLGWTSGGALAVILRYIFDGKSIEESIQLTIEYCKSKSECAELVPVMENAVKVAKEGLVGEDAFRNLGQGWVAEEALAIAIWASLMYPNDIRQAIIASVNHSGDSDSTGCVAGYIVGAANGADKVPEDWLEHLELKDVIEQQVKELLHMDCFFC